MPDIENTDLGWLIQFLGRVNTLGKRGMRAALASQPRCRLGMLEHLHFQIEQSGQDGSIYVSELARAMRQPMPAVSRGLRLLEQDGHILRETDPNDRRKTLVRITPEGEQARLAGHARQAGRFPGGQPAPAFRLFAYCGPDPGGAGPDGGPEGRLPRRHRGRERCFGARPCKQERRPRA